MFLVTMFFVSYFLFGFELLIAAILAFLECIMDLIETEGEILQSFTEIANASVCTEYCQRNENCFIWTYRDGVCFMKNDKTFLIQTESDRLFSGIKGCSGKGEIYIITKRILLNIFIREVK